MEARAILNEYLQPLIDELTSDLLQHHGLDPFNRYLLGVLYAQRESKNEAIKHLIIACNDYPWNWSAWKLLAQQCSSSDDISQMIGRLNEHYMRDFFMAQANFDLHRNQQCLEIFNRLCDLFPYSTFICGQIATANQNLIGKLVEIVGFCSIPLKF